MTPSTAAGRALLAAPWMLLPGQPLMADQICAIEAEARGEGFTEGLEHAKATYGPGHAIAERARLAELIEARSGHRIESRDDIGRALCRHNGRGRGVTRLVLNCEVAAVLALLDPQP